jgi:hypothetical protein
MIHEPSVDPKRKPGRLTKLASLMLRIAMVRDTSKNPRIMNNPG